MLGLPVVCLDLGGVAMMAGPNALVVSSSSSPHDIEAGLARTMDEARRRNSEFRPYLEWTRENYAAFLRRVYRDESEVAWAPTEGKE